MIPPFESRYSSDDIAVPCRLRARESSAQRSAPYVNDGICWVVARSKQHGAKMIVGVWTAL
jgi:hypothetical protein